jgi:hypothetical protein
MSSTAAGVPPFSLVILHQPQAAPDADLALTLEHELRKLGHGVFLDRRQVTGLKWAHELERELQRADLVLALISAASAQSELLAYELEVAAQFAEQQNGRPALLPVRVFYRGPVSEALSMRLHPIEFEWSADEERYISRMVLWRSPADDRALVGLVADRLAGLVRPRADPSVSAAPAAVRPLPALEPPGGAVPLDSTFYLERPTDGVFLAAVERRDSLVLVKGARQMGKTSLLARGLQRVRASGCRVAMTDFQKLQAPHFQTLAAFYGALAELIADQLDLEVPEPQRWERNPNAAFEAFWTSGLAALPQPVLWAVDEFDRLFTSPLGGEVCGLLRSWHNARALDPSLPWRRLTIAIAYATEAHLFIDDLNQSPFNVGTRLVLQDFTPAEMAELNQRYGRPLREGNEIQRLHELLGGQPYLVRCALNEMASHQRGLDWLEHLSGEEESVFGEHLRRLLYSVSRDPEVTETVRKLLTGEGVPAKDLFYRLRSAGVIVGTEPAQARFRCGLYEQYLRRHLG